MQTDWTPQGTGPQRWGEWGGSGWCWAEEESRSQGGRSEGQMVRAAQQAASLLVGSPRAFCCLMCALLPKDWGRGKPVWRQGPQARPSGQLDPHGQNPSFYFF